MVRLTKSQIERALADCAGVRKLAAAVLSISQPTLVKLCRRFEIPLGKMGRPTGETTVAVFERMRAGALQSRLKPAASDGPWPPAPPLGTTERMDWLLARDLATLTKAEMDAKWYDRLDEVERVLRKPWSELCPPDHNPIYYLAEKVWFDNVEHNPRFLYPPYHRDRICVPVMSYLMDPNPKEAGLVWLGPRHSFKSTFFQGVIPMHRILRAKLIDNVDLRQVFRHHKEQMAGRNLVRYKNKFRKHAWLREHFPEACPPPNIREWGTQTEFTLPWVAEGTSIAEPSCRAVGATGTDTGSHGDEDYNDDLVTEEHRDSKKIRDDALMRYEARRYQIEPGTGRECNSGTPYHPRDLWAKMRAANVEGEQIYRIYVNHAIEDDGTLALPTRLSQEFLDKRRQEEISRTGTDDMWYLQYQCEPRLTRIAATDIKWLNMVEHAEIPPCFTVITVDPAWKGTKNCGEGDSASTQVWGLERRGGVVLRYLLDGAHSNEMSSADGEKEIFRLMVKWHARHVAPEEHGGSTFRSALRNTAIALGMQLTIIDLKTKNINKDKRIVGFIKEAEVGRVYISKACDPNLLDHFTEQFRDYTGPDSLDHDDGLDAAAYTCDPNILDAWVPMWDSWGGDNRPAWMGPKREEPEVARRTRHCGL